VCLCVYEGGGGGGGGVLGKDRTVSREQVLGEDRKLV
jgi:hypothetical protein